MRMAGPAGRYLIVRVIITSAISASGSSCCETSAFLSRRMHVKRLKRSTPSCFENDGGVWCATRAATVVPSPPISRGVGPALYGPRLPARLLAAGSVSAIGIEVAPAWCAANCTAPAASPSTPTGCSSCSSMADWLRVLCSASEAAAAGWTSAPPLSRGSGWLASLAADWARRRKTSSIEVIDMP